MYFVSTPETEIVLTRESKFESKEVLSAKVQDFLDISTTKKLYSPLLIFSPPNGFYTLHSFWNFIHEYLIVSGEKPHNKELLT